MKAYAAIAAFAVFIAVATSPASADKYHVTAAEQAACGPDAVSLCSDAGRDEDKLIACMKANRSSLSALCGPVFDAGMRSRGLH